MADDAELSDRVYLPRNNWELVSFEKADHASEGASLSSSGSNEPSFYDQFINKDYFAAPSTVPPYNTDQQQMGEVNNASQGVENAVSPPPSNQQLDWIEPSVPIQSCVIGTSEDDEISSRTCSDDSREESMEHLAREKDAIMGFHRDAYVCDYAAVSHDVPMVVIQRSNIEPREKMNDASSGGHRGDVSWRRCLGLWLSEARQASTFSLIALAAAVIGLVLVGSGWQGLHLHYQKLRCRVFSKGKGISQVMHHLVQIKDSSSKHRRIALLKA